MLQTQIDLNKACQKGWRPPEKLDLDDWADKYRYINQVTGEKWFTSTVEVARGPMKAVTELGVRTITVMCSTQTLKTELILNTIGYFMHVDPCPMLVVQPKDEIAKRFSNVRLKQMLRASPVLRNLVEESRRRDASDTAGHKEFPGGHVTIVGSRSPGNLAMLPIRVVLLDEIDKYEESSGAEGDPIDLAEERMATYSANSLSIRVCSPTTKDLSRIEESYETSDMRKPFAVCPHCNEKQIMMWKNVKWDKDDKGNSKAETAQYCCIHCGVLWTEGQRLEALQGIIWRQTAEFTCSECEHINQPEKWKPTDGHKWKGVRAVCEECGKGKCPNKHAGFWASKLYSPFRPLSELVERWIEAQGNIEKLKAFINTQLAETFEETGDQLTSIDGLLARREKYDELPDEVGLITAAVDVQNNRLEMEVVGWGLDEESWSLDYHIIPGDPHKPQVWVDLEEKLNKTYRRTDGRISYIVATCIDLGGGHTQEVANFCKDKIERRIWPIRGIASAGRPYPVWPKNPGRTAKINLPFYNVGVDAGKNVIFSRMLIETPGPGYCHLPHDRDLSWFEQFTAERRVQKRKGTQMYYVWENKKNARNESFDCFDEKTEVLTNEGWKFFKDLSGEEGLLTTNLETMMMEYQKPSHLIEKDYDGEMISLKGRRLDILVTPNHRMITFKKEQKKTATGRKWNFDVPPKITLAKDLTIHHQLMMAADWKGKNYRKITLPAITGKYIGRPIREKKIDAADWADFLGWYISEGHCQSYRSKTQGNMRYRVIIDQNPGENADSIEAILKKMDINFCTTVMGKCNRYVILSKQIFEAVQECGRGCQNKKVPEWLKQSSPRIIKRFLDSAIAGDGWTNTQPNQRTMRTYTTTSPQLADDIQELFLKIGCASNIRTRQFDRWDIAGRSGTNVRLQYNITECKTRKASLDGGGNGKREYLGKKVQYKGKVYCATVPNGTLICRRNGLSFIAGNCRGYAYAALCGLQSMGWSVNIITEEQRLIMDSEFEESGESRSTDTTERQTTSSPRQATRRINKSSFMSR